MENAQGALSTQLLKFHLEYGRREARPSIFSNKHPSESDRTQWISPPADDQRCIYLSLPGEIRNRIMELTLCPGDVYLRAKKYCGAGKAAWTSPCKMGSFLHDMELRPLLSAKTLTVNHLPSRDLPLTLPKRARDNRLRPYWLPDPRFKPPKPVGLSQISKNTEYSWYNGKSKPSWQLLATCKQVYYEGNSFLYGLNVFHLATGDLRNSLVHFRRVRESSFTLLRKVCLDMSLADLDLDVKNYTNMDFEIRRFNCPTLSTRRRHTLARHTLYILRNLWASKLAYIRGFQSLDQLIINFSLPSPPPYRKFYHLQGWLCDTWIIRGPEISKALRAIQPREESFPLSAHGRIRHSLDSFYDGWDPETEHWFIQALRRAEHLLRENVPEDGLRTFEPWLLGMASNPYDGQDVVVRTRGGPGFHIY